MSGRESYSAALDKLANDLSSDEHGSLSTKSGRDLHYFVVKQYSHDELEMLERNWRIELPNAYKQFLLRIGAGQFFFDPKDQNSGVEFRRIDDLCEAIATTTYTRRELFATYLPIGRDCKAGCALVLGIDSEIEGLVFSVVDLPNHWEDLQLESCAGEEFSTWLLKFM